MYEAYEWNLYVNKQYAYKWIKSIKLKYLRREINKNK